MLHGWVIVPVSFAYLGTLFAIAYYGDHRADRGRSIIANPYIYALSLGVYATAWTFYGSVGRAASDGVGFLPIYIGPTLMMALWWVVMRKIIRISKANRITSLADFVSSRYGKSAALAGLVTVIAVVGVVPYIALQLKAVSHSFSMLVRFPDVAMSVQRESTPILADTAFWMALVLAAFTILFGTRHLDASERHEGLVAAIAFESIVKLVAFLAVGSFITWGIYDGFADIFARASSHAKLSSLFAPLNGAAGSYAGWASLTVLSMFAIMFLPRQFQIAVVENVNENHLRKAIWLFPLYMLAMNVFVIPVAFGGVMHFAGSGVDPDTFVLTLPMSEKQEALALLVFIGGLSAATGMVIVETIALSTMMCNDLVMPVLLRMTSMRLAERTNLTGLLLGIRRGAIVAIVLLGYFYFRLAGEAYALVAIGLISFAAVAQFAPAVIGGIYWKGATRSGALAGLAAGFAVWLYTLLLPSFAKSGWLPIGFLENGPFGVALLKPYALFGLEGLNDITHAMLWSALANVGAYVSVSVLTRQGAAEQAQAARFVDVYLHGGDRPDVHVWKGTASLPDVKALLARFLGPARADAAIRDYARRRGVATPEQLTADAGLVQFAETTLAGAIGGASARIMVASTVNEDALSIEEVRTMLDDASQVIAYSHELEHKSRELMAATAELRAANERLKELDRLKDDFVSTVTHELRTPLTSIRAFSEILHDNPALDAEERQKFLNIIIQESERLTRLINQVLDLAKLESGRAEWQIGETDMNAIVRDSIDSTSQLFRAKNVGLETRLPPDAPFVRADRDRLVQVLINLLSNAVKFVPADSGRVVVEVRVAAGMLAVRVVDNGPGIAAENQQVIFEKFRQAGDTMTEKPQGTGLGLPISRQIIEHLGGRLWVESAPGQGATFIFELPVVAAAATPGALAGQSPEKGTHASVRQE
ncbi:MAG TPA: sensor histidine kinase [Casimicrobiaceae bacterium]|nr:sensor histidine kinase [Casimicrobiaceae bacterium]